MKSEMYKTILETTDRTAKMITKAEWVIMEQPNWIIATAYSKLAQENERW